MSVSAETLRDRWQVQLATTVDPFHSGGSPGEEKLVRLARTMPIPVLRLDPARTWFWSDPHFGDPTALLSGRPFRDVGHMNDTLFAHWHRCVRPSETIICLGDVGGGEAWADPELAPALAACPGERLLIIGNHDVDQFEPLGRADFRRQYAAAVCDTSPLLVLTHVPLRQVPRTAVNMHGHLHDQAPPSERHRNLSVERTGYAPIRLDEILADAKTV